MPIAIQNNHGIRNYGWQFEAQEISFDVSGLPSLWQWLVRDVFDDLNNLIDRDFVERAPQNDEARIEFEMGDLDGISTDAAGYAEMWVDDDFTHLTGGHIIFDGAEAAGIEDIVAYHEIMHIVASAIDYPTVSGEQTIMAYDLSYPGAYRAGDIQLLQERYGPSPDDNAVAGGAGSGSIAGGLGDDVIYGNQGFDILYGNQGDDSLFGGRDADWLFGGQGNDVLVGGAGADTLVGGAGVDTFYVGSGDTVLDYNPTQDIWISV